MATQDRNPHPIPWPVAGQDGSGEQVSIDKDNLLDKALALLSTTLDETSRQIGENEGDITRLGPLVARLSDTIARVKLAEVKLEQAGEGFAWMQEEFDRMLRYMGLGSRDNGPRPRRRPR